MALGEQYMSHLKLSEALGSKLVGFRKLSEGLVSRIASTQRLVRQAFAIPTANRPQVGVGLAGIHPFEASLAQFPLQTYFPQRAAPLEGLGADTGQLRPLVLLSNNYTKKSEGDTQSRPISSTIHVGLSSLNSLVKSNYSNYVPSFFGKKGQFSELIGALGQPNKETTQEKRTGLEEFLTSVYETLNTGLSAPQKAFKSSAEAVAGQGTLPEMPTWARALQFSAQLAFNSWGGMTSLLTTGVSTLLNRLFDGKDEAIAAFKQSMNDLTHTFQSIVQPLSDFVEKARSWLTDGWNKLRKNISTGGNWAIGRKSKTPAQQKSGATKNPPSTQVGNNSAPSGNGEKGQSFVRQGGVAVSPSGLQNSEEQTVQENIAATVTSGRRSSVVNVNIGTAVNIEALINQTGEGLEEISNKVVEAVIQAINEGALQGRTVIGGI